MLTDVYSICTSLCHPTETRPLSLRERARVQQFPDDWQFLGSLAERFAQVGNAVPVGLAKVCGEVMANLLDALGSETPDRDGRPPWRIVRLLPRVRTRR